MLYVLVLAGAAMRREFVYFGLHETSERRLLG